MRSISRAVIAGSVYHALGKPSPRSSSSRSVRGWVGRRLMPRPFAGTPAVPHHRTGSHGKVARFTSGDHQGNRITGTPTTACMAQHHELYRRASYYDIVFD